MKIFLKLGKMNLMKTGREAQIKLSLETERRLLFMAFPLRQRLQEEAKQNFYTPEFGFSVSNTPVHSVRSQHFPALHCQGAKVTSAHSGQNDGLGINRE